MCVAVECKILAEPPTSSGSWFAKASKNLAACDAGGYFRTLLEGGKFQPFRPPGVQRRMRRHGS